jgi:hypothetical protein
MQTTITDTVGTYPFLAGGTRTPPMSALKALCSDLDLVILTDTPDSHDPSSTCYALGWCDDTKAGIRRARVMPWFISREALERYCDHHFESILDSDGCTFVVPCTRRIP